MTETLKKISEFLWAMIKRLRHNWGLKLLSLVFAIILWSTVVFTTNPEAPRTADDLGITIMGLEELDDKGLALEHPTSYYLSQSVKVSMLLDRRELEYYDERNITVQLDLSRVHTPGEHEVKLKVFNSNGIGKVEKVSPQYITVHVDNKESRIIPVECITKGAVPTGYYKSELSLTPNAVQVSGPQKVVSQIEKAQVMLDLGGLTESVNRTREYTLVDENDTAVDKSALELSSESVTLQMDITPIKHFSIVGKSILLGSEKIKKGYYIEKVEVYPKSVAVTGPKELLDTMQISTGAIDVSNASEDIEKELTITVPQGLTLLTGDRVTVIVRISEVLKEVTFEQIPVQLMNIPQGLTVENFDLKADVTIKVPVNNADQISSSHVNLYVDLSDLQAGEHTLHVNAEISDAFDVNSITSSIDQTNVTLVKR